MKRILLLPILTVSIAASVAFLSGCGGTTTTDTVKTPPATSSTGTSGEDGGTSATPGSSTTAGSGGTVAPAPSSGTTETPKTGTTAVPLVSAPSTASTPSAASTASTPSADSTSSTPKPAQPVTPPSDPETTTPGKTVTPPATSGTTQVAPPDGPDKPIAVDPVPGEGDDTPTKTSTAKKTDWNGWGGKLDRNMVDHHGLKNMPVEVDIEKGLNVKWIAELGSQTYGNPSIVDGKIFIGTNNEGARDPELTGDRGNIFCLREEDGKFLWQAVHDKLAAGRVNDWPLQGICSAPWVEGDRFWYFNNRAEIVCADTEGFLDNENDGMQDEQYKGETKADIVWIYDTIEELGNFPHNLATSSPVVWSNLVIVVTGNGVDEGHLNCPSVRAPSFIAVDKNTGELVWEFLADKDILHGQWSSPAMGQVNGEWQVYLPGGDGILYALNPESGELIWKFDMNPPDSKWELGGYGTRNNIISTPVFVDGHVYLGVGQDPEHGTGIGHFFKIDASRKGDVTGTWWKDFAVEEEGEEDEEGEPKEEAEPKEDKDAVKTAAQWHRGGDDFGRTMSTAAVHEGLVYISDLEGYLYCLDADTGELVWKQDLQAACWGSPMIIDNKVYMGDEDGEIVILATGREKKVLGEFELESSTYCTPVPANGVLYIVSKSKLYAIASE